MLNQRKELAYNRNVALINLPNFFEENGGVVIMEGMTHVPFNIARVFTVVAPKGSLRGQHAHKNCSQFLTCPTGSIEVVCDDGETTVTYILDNPRIGLLIPPSIWAQQKYLEQNSILNVLCDCPYEAGEYIRDYQQFKNYRK